MGLVVRGNYVWCLLLVIILWDLEDQKGVVGCFRVIIWGGTANRKEAGLFIWEKTGSHYVVLRY